MDNNSNMLQLCRLCLVKDDVNIPIFEEQGDIRQIFLKISSCLPVKVSRDDRLPKKICDGCSYKLDMLYEFWNTSANAEKQLLTWLGEAGMTSQMADGTISAVAQQIKPSDDFVKQEAIDPPDIQSDDDDKDYVFPEKEDEKSRNNVDEPPPKRARRTAAVKAAIAMDQDSDDDDSGEPMTKIEDDSEDSDNDDHEPAFVDVPSTSADDQPGPSGVGKDGVEAPVINNGQANMAMFILIQPNAGTNNVIQNNNTRSIIQYNVIEGDKIVPQYRHYTNRQKPEPALPPPPPLTQIEPNKQNNFTRSIIQYNLREGDKIVPHYMHYKHENKPEPALPNIYNIPLPPLIQLDYNKETNSSKNENPVMAYKNPFNYSNIDFNLKRSSVDRKLKLVEKELYEERPVNWICLICGNEYQEKSALIDHYEIHKQIADQLEDDNDDDQDQRILCPVCVCNFTNVASYLGHVDLKHKPKEHICEVCRRWFSNNFNLSIHMQQHNSDSNTEIICVVCKKFSTSSSSDLANHMLSEHDKDSFSCDECGKDFTSETWFNDHKIFHIKNKIFYCDKCDMHCQHQRGFIVHMRKYHKINVDAKVKKVKCTDCDLTFAKEENLKSHNRCIHTHANAFLCNICGAGYSMKSRLTGHMKNHGAAGYICSTCGKTFKQCRTLTIHALTHTGEKPYKCHICEKSFSQKGSLNIHLRIHSGERPYNCEKCKNGFITKTVRDAHQKSCKRYKATINISI